MLNKGWRQGVIGIPVAGTDEMKAAKYYVRCFDEANEYGINEGKIRQLIINMGKDTTAYYDEEWVIEPKADDEATQVALCILLNEYN